MEERAGVEEAVGEDKDAGEWGAGRMSGTRSRWWWCCGDGGVDGAASGRRGHVEAAGQRRGGGAVASGRG